MKLSIRSLGFRLTEALDKHVRDRLARALHHGGRQIAAVMVRLRDLNGPHRRGVDKHCQVQLQLAEGRTVVVSEADADLYAAITRAASRSKRILLQRLDDRHARPRARRRRSQG